MNKKISLAALALAGGAGVYAIANRKSNPNCPLQGNGVKALATATDFYQFKLKEKENVTHDTRRFRFELPDPKSTLGIMPGQHVVSKAIIDEKPVFRPYSPTSFSHEQGSFDLTLKVYNKPNPKFPDGGKMSKYLDSLKPGDVVEFKGPVGRMRYLGNGSFGTILEKDGPEVTRTFKNVGMIAGGTGLTPLFQIAKTVCNEPCKFKSPNISFIFSNHTENDILLKEELEQLEKKCPQKFKIWYTISKALKPSEWKYDLGHVNEEMLKKHLPPPNDEDTIILVCGPPDFVKKTCVPLLQKLGYGPKNIFEY